MVLAPTILLFSSSSISSLLLLAFGPLPNAKFNWTEEARGGEEKRREEKRREEKRRRGSSSCHFVAVE